MNSLGLPGADKLKKTQTHKNPNTEQARISSFAICYCLWLTAVKLSSNKQ